MDAQQQLFGLMTLAEEHQKAVKAAIDGLAAERQALAKDRAMLIQAAASITKTAAEVIPAIQKATGAAVGDAVRGSLVEASSDAVTALNEACRPVIDRLAGVVRVAEDAKTQLNTASKWFAWKFVALAFFGLVGVCLVAWASVLWQMDQVEQLTAEVAKLKATRADLVKRGGRVDLTTCGEKKRLCTRVETDQSYGDGYYVFKGY